MDRKTLLAITLCFLIFALWQKFYLEPRTQRAGFPTSEPSALSMTSAPSAQASGAPQAQAPTGTVSAPTGAQPPIQAPQSKTLTSQTGELTISNGAQFFTGWNLKGYLLDIGKPGANVDLGSVTNQPGEVEIAFDDPSLAYLNQVMGSLKDVPNGVQWSYEDANVKLTRDFSTSPSQPYVDLRLTAEFKTKRPAYAFLSVGSHSYKDDPEAQDRQLLYWSNDSLERVHMKDTVALKEVQTTVKYVGAANRYFLFAVMAEGPQDTKGLLQPTAQGSGKMNLVYPVQGNSITIPVKVFFGPKELTLLRSVNPLLDHTVDFGWFTFFAYPLLQLLKWLYGFVKNYGVAIILLTLLIKVVTYPLTYKSMKSMKEMAKIQPQLQRVREKYKDDKEALNREMLTLMRSHGYNPMAGCFPILIQMPIFFALYRVLYSSIELYHAPFALWIHDLSSKDPYYVTPVLLSVTMFIQQKLTPQTATDPAQQKMLQFMPLMFGAFMLGLPAGLTVYMLANALASIVQQIMLNKKLGGPTAAGARA